MIALPPWLPQENWDAFIEMRRKTIKRPATDFALMLVLKELYALKEGGQDPLACLNQSIVNGWCDVYALKEKKANRAAISDVARTKAALRENELESRGILKEQLAENAKKARERVGLKQRTLQ